jgi:hypothetical protein
LDSHGCLFGWKCPELPASLGPPTANAGAAGIASARTAKTPASVLRLMLHLLVRGRLPDGAVLTLSQMERVRHAEVGAMPVPEPRRPRGSAPRRPAETWDHRPDACDALAKSRSSCRGAKPAGLRRYASGAPTSARLGARHCARPLWRARRSDHPLASLARQRRVSWISPTRGGSIPSRHRRASPRRVA